VHAAQKKSGVDEIRYVNDINELWPPARQERGKPGLYNIVATLNAEDIISLAPDDPRYLEKRTNPAQSRLFDRVDLDRHVLEHGSERGVGTTDDPDDSALPDQAGQELQQELFSSATVPEVVDKENFHYPIYGLRIISLTRINREKRLATEITENTERNKKMN
jgi:hypothetical protein